MEKLTLHVKHFVVLLVLLRLLLLLPWLAGCLLSAVWLGYLQLLLWLMLLSTMTARLRVEQGRRFAVDELLLILLLLPISFWNISQLLCFCCIIFLFCSTCFCSFFLHKLFAQRWRRRRRRRQLNDARCWRKRRWMPTNNDTRRNVFLWCVYQKRNKDGDGGFSFFFSFALL